MRLWVLTMALVLAVPAVAGVAAADDHLLEARVDTTRYPGCFGPGGPPPEKETTTSLGPVKVTIVECGEWDNDT